jgi:hypothetical protein
MGERNERILGAGVRGGAPPGQWGLAGSGWDGGGLMGAGIGTAVAVGGLWEPCTGVPVLAWAGARLGVVLGAWVFG